MPNRLNQEPAEPEDNDSISRAITPRNHDSSTIVTLLCNPDMTTIPPAHTLVTPPPHTSLSSKQALVLDVLIRNSSRKTNYSYIGAALGVSKSAARDAVVQLVSKEYISKPETIRDGVFQGFSYWTDSIKCQQFMDKGGASNEKYFVFTDTPTPPPHTGWPPSDPPHTLSSSVCNLEIKLTTNTVDLNEPELLWWNDQGLTAKQIEVWIDQFKMKPEDLSQALRFARYDIVENKKVSNGELIAKPIDYFFVKVRASGHYPRPPGYKSVFEIRAEHLEKQKRLDEIARKKIWDAEIEGKMKELLNDKESPLFQELLCCVDAFAKENQDALEISMKELLKERYPLGNSVSKG